MFGFGKGKKQASSSCKIGGVAITIKATLGSKHTITFEAPSTISGDVSRYIFGVIVKHLQAQAIEFDGCDLRDPRRIVVTTSSRKVTSGLLDATLKQLSGQIKDQERLKALMKLSILRDQYKDNPIKIPDEFLNKLGPKG